MSKSANAIDKAVCVRCGATKKKPWQICDECGLNPETDDLTLAKSVYLSTARYEQTDDKENYLRTLDDAARDLRTGQAITYDEKELERILELGRMIDQVTRPGLVLYLLRLFLPMIVTLVVLWTLYFLLGLLGAP